MRWRSESGLVLQPQESLRRAVTGRRGADAECLLHLPVNSLFELGEFIVFRVIAASLRPKVCLIGSSCFAKSTAICLASSIIQKPYIQPCLRQLGRNSKRCLAGQCANRWQILLGFRRSAMAGKGRPYGNLQRQAAEQVPKRLAASRSGLTANDTSSFLR
jgi:hypothetical protein